jgi:curli production assembly/transport component CsgE
MGEKYHKTYLYLAPVLFAAYISLSLAAQEVIDADDAGLEIDGLIVDETRTRMGSDFYDLFYTNWEAPPEARNFTIVIMEQPAPQMGTRMTLKVNDQEVAQFMLQPRYEIIEELALQSVQFLRQHLSERELMRLRLEREGEVY